MIRVRRCDCGPCEIQGRHFWLVTPREGLLPIVLLSFPDAIRTADSYAQRKAAA